MTGIEVSVNVPGELYVTQRQKLTESVCMISVEKNTDAGGCNNCPQRRDGGTRHSRNLFTMLSLLSSSLPLVCALSINLSNMTSSGQLKNNTDVLSQTERSNSIAWSIFRGKPSIKKRPWPFVHPGEEEGGAAREARMAFSSS